MSAGEREAALGRRGREPARARRARSGARGEGRPTRRTRRRRLPRPGPRLLAALALLLAILAGGWLWLRTSSLVAVRQVSIAGVSGPDAGQIRQALTAAARNMTTLDVKMGALRTAVAPYPVVKHVRVATHFPHRMRIEVVEQVPVAEISAVGRRIAVAADGTLLRDAPPTAALPTIPLSLAPGGERATGTALREVRLLAAAPYALLAKVSEVSIGSAHGLVAQLRDGPAVYFGAGSDLAAKWSALTDVLGAPSSAGAVYIDVSDPARPAAGAGSSAASAASATSTTPTANTTGSTAIPSP